MYETLTTTQNLRGARVVDIRGEIDIATADALGERLDQAADGADFLVVSLAECPYIDSSGLRVLVRMSRELGPSFAVVVPPSTQTRRIFDITGLAHQMDVFDSVDEALESMEGAPGASPAAF
jgi:anti-anti-sigma factor